MDTALRRAQLIIDGIEGSRVKPRVLYGDWIVDDDAEYKVFSNRIILGKKHCDPDVSEAHLRAVLLHELGHAHDLVGYMTTLIGMLVLLTALISAILIIVLFYVPFLLHLSPLSILIHYLSYLFCASVLASVLLMSPLERARRERYADAFATERMNNYINFKNISDTGLTLNA